MTGRTLEDEVETHLAASYSAAFGKDPTPEWLEAIGMRVGTRGPLATLDEAGQFVGVTRERVRQVVAKIAPYMRGADVPGIREIAETLVVRSPVPEPIGRRLARTGRTRTTLTGEGFLNILGMIGTSPEDLVGTGLVCVDGWLVEESEVPVMRSISMARKHTSTYGMTTVEEIRQALATAENPLDPADIRRVLRAELCVKWAGDWLWVDKDLDSPHSNRLVNTARSILSVNSPQSVASIHEGAHRLWKFRKLDILAPAAAMRVFFEVSPYFVVQGDLVRAVEPLDYHEVLGGVTSAMVDVLKSTPHQVMDRRTLHETCTEAGLKASTVGIWTTFAEWMENIAPNVWGLRGSNPNPAVVEEIRAAARARLKQEPRRRRFEWATDGTLQITADITASAFSSGTLTFDAAFHPPVAGRTFTLVSDGVAIGTIKVGDEHLWSWGWGRVFWRDGVKAGDVVRANINLLDGTGQVVTGGHELWA